LHVDFADNSLRRLVTEPGFCPPGWDAAESRHARLVTQCAQAAKALGDLHAMRMLRIQPFSGDPPATSIARLSERRCLFLAYSGTDGTAAVTISVAPATALTEESEKSR
jgi:hypothetical protein